MPIVRQLVPCLLLGCIAGCYGAQVRDDGGSVDASSRADAALPLLDAEPAADLGVVDAGPTARCSTTPGEPTRIAAACLDWDVIPPNQPYDLPVFFTGRCFCGETLACNVQVTGPFALSISTVMCSEGPLCDACFPRVDGVCTLPPLAEGTWSVQLDGAPAMSLVVAPRVPAILPVSLCATPAPARTEGPSWMCPYPGDRLSSASICHRAMEPAGAPFEVRVIDPCGGCFDVAGGCTVTRNGPGLELEPRRRRCDCATCGACPPVCTPLEITCFVPALEPGTYSLHVAGRPVDEIESVRVQGSAGGPVVPLACATPAGR